MGSEVPQPRAASCLRPNRIGAVGAGGAESSFDARRAAPLLLSQVAAPHALQRLRHGCCGCASLSSVCQRNGCARGCNEVLRKQAPRALSGVNPSFVARHVASCMLRSQTPVGRHEARKAAQTATFRAQLDQNGCTSTPRRGHAAQVAATGGRGLRTAIAATTTPALLAAVVTQTAAPLQCRRPLRRGPRRRG